MELSNIGIVVDTKLVTEYKNRLVEAGYNVGRIIILEDETKSNMLIKIAYSDILGLSSDLLKIKRDLYE